MRVRHGRIFPAAMRAARDRTLDMPRLILPSLQVNMRAGHFPTPEDNGRVYLNVPINLFKGEAPR